MTNEFDVKMNENFHCKAQMVADGHKTETLALITYLLVVSCNSVYIALTIALLNKLKIQSYDIKNTYLTTPFQEKFWMISGSEFGSNKGKQMLVVHALYDLKPLCVAFCTFLVEMLHNAGYRPLYADPDVWMRPAIKATA